MLLASARFGAALGLAPVTLIRDTVARTHVGYASDVIEQQIRAAERGTRAAFWFCAGSLIIGEWARPGLRWTSRRQAWR
jgi:hypothetical protein